MKLRGRLGALEEREFRLLWLSRVVSDFGDRFGTIGLAFAVLAIERSAAALAYVLAARTIASIALFPRRRRLGRPAAAAAGDAHIRRWTRHRHGRNGRSAAD